MILVIDDVRDIHGDIICRTVEAAKAVLQLKIATILYLDHDLQSKESGYDILNWAFENDLVPSKVVLVTSNPPGRKMMELALVDNDYEFNHTEYYWEKK